MPIFVEWKDTLAVSTKPTGESHAADEPLVARPPSTYR
jgi:hypothetical protein